MADMQKSDPQHKPRVVTVGGDKPGTLVANTIPNSGGQYFNDSGAEKFCAERNEKAEAMGLKTRYKVEK